MNHGLGGKASGGSSNIAGGFGGGGGLTIQTVLATTVVAEVVDFLVVAVIILIWLIITGLPMAVAAVPIIQVLIRTILLEQIVGMERLLLLFYLKRVLMHPQLLLNPVR